MGRRKKDTAQYPEGAAVVDRMLEAYGCSTLVALAAAIGEKESTVKNWRYRGSVPTTVALKASKDTGRELDWLLSGVQHVPASRVIEQSANPSDSPAARASRFIEKSATNAAFPRALLTSMPPAPPWLAEPPSITSPRAVQARGDGPRGAGVASRERALLPAPATGAARPLVLSLAVGEDDLTVDYEVIPRLVGVASAGALRRNDPPDNAGGGQPVADLAGEFAFSYEWLARNLQHTSGELATIQVHGDSMTPTLIDGDTIVIDRGVREVHVGGIYVIEMLGQRHVKRLQRRADGSLVIISDNPAYERETVSRGQVGEIGVLGRMVWPRVR